MSTPGLSAVAAYVFRSLHDHPDLRLPEAIAAGPAVDGALDARQVSDGLAELESLGMAENEPGGGWRLTEPQPAES
jgi:hypothetical protein